MLDENEMALFDQLEDVFNAVDEEGVKDLSSMGVEQLLNRFHELDEYLKKEQQILRPHTQEARDAHSERNAIQVVLHEKGVT